MRVDEYAACDATALAEVVRRGEVTAAEVYQAAVAALAAVDRDLNAVAGGPWDRPLDYAADGPFGGVPFVLKDLGCHPAGVPIRGGSRLSGDGIVYDSESFLIRRFREAGLAVAALATTPEFGFCTTTEATVYGPTRNPWDVTRSPGGSSGGSAALVAAGAVPVSHGGDGGGSIRIPAACNGLVGLKPSRGRISTGPEHQEVLSGLAAEFVHSRTMRDTAALLDAVAGAVPGDKFAIREPARPFVEELGADPGRLRIALRTETWSDVPVDPEVAAATEAVARQLEALGHEVEVVSPELDWDRFVSALMPIWSANIVEGVEGMAAASGLEPGPERLEHTIWAAYEYARRLTVAELAAARQTLNAIVRATGEFLAGWDLLLTPTMNVPPLPLGQLDANDPSVDVEGWTRAIFGVCSFTPLFNCTGTPAISLPLGWTSSGLPVGVQLVVPMCEEATLIQVGSQLEQAMPWGERRPAVHAAAPGRVG